MMPPGGEYPQNGCSPEVTVKGNRRHQINEALGLLFHQLPVIRLITQQFRSDLVIYPVQRQDTMVYQYGSLGATGIDQRGQPLGLAKRICPQQDVLRFFFQFPYFSNRVRVTDGGISKRTLRDQYVRLYGYQRLAGIVRLQFVITGVQVNCINKILYRYL